MPESLGRESQAMSSYVTKVIVPWIVPIRLLRHSVGLAEKILPIVSPPVRQVPPHSQSFGW